MRVSAANCVVCQQVDRSQLSEIPKEELSKEERKRLKKEKKEKKKAKKERKKAKKEKEAARERSESGDDRPASSDSDGDHRRRSLEEDLRQKALDAMHSK